MEAQNEEIDVMLIKGKRTKKECSKQCEKNCLAMQTFMREDGGGQEKVQDQLDKMPGGSDRFKKFVTKAGYISREENESVEVDLDVDKEFNYVPVCMIVKDGLNEPMADSFTAFALCEAIIRRTVDPETFTFKDKEGKEWQIEDKDYQQVLTQSWAKYDKTTESESSDEPIDSKAIPEWAIYNVLAASKESAEVGQKRELVVDSVPINLICLGALR